ncbi:hypothetical protein [Paracoccus lutimaris]|uniref:hypothetical protein n=1 Tax=Paracoccus lutimaris TaxID=1490030 RepID=UPI0011C045EB|nr:hypothetical protein [Paracoccus lutimaris]
MIDDDSVLTGELANWPTKSALAEIFRSDGYLVAFSRRVSKNLANAGLRHRLEIYSGTGELVADLHHDWPKDW